MDSYYPQESLGIDLRQYLVLLRRWAWLLILATVLAGATAFVVGKRMTPIYQASTTVLIDEAPSSSTSDYAALLMSERRVLTYSELMTQEPVLEAVLERLGLEAGMSVTALKGAVTVQPVRDTQLIEMRVEGPDSARAAQIANAIVAVFVEQNQALQESRYVASKESLGAQLAEIEQQIKETSAALEALGNNPENKAEKDRLETALTEHRRSYASLLQSYEQIRVAEAQTLSNVVQVNPASMPQAPIRPRVMMNTALAAAVGLMLAVGVVFLIEALDDTLKSPDEITRHLGLPILGLVASHESADGKPIAASQPRSPVTEAFRALRTNTDFASVDRPLRTLLVTSPTPSDGKTTVAANLAVVFAQSGRRVVLMDADLRRPMLHTRLNLPNRAGLSGLFVQPQVHLDGNLQELADINLSVLTAGNRPPNPSELLGSEKMSEILRQIQGQADVLVIDSPPVMVVTDAAVLAPRVDGVLLVVKPGVTKLAACKQAVEQLQRGGANLLGVVLNEVETKGSRYYSYRYYHSYYYAYSNYYDDGGDDKKRRRRHRKKQETGTSS